VGSPAPAAGAFRLLAYFAPADPVLLPLIAGRQAFLPQPAILQGYAQMRDLSGTN
jgi:hypothetical protein